MQLQPSMSHLRGTVAADRRQTFLQRQSVVDKSTYGSLHGRTAAATTTKPVFRGGVRPTTASLQSPDHKNSPNKARFTAA